MPAALERISGQLDPAGAGPGVCVRPVDRDAVHIGLGGGQEEAPDAALTPLQSADDGGFHGLVGGRLRRVLDGVQHPGHQHRMRAHLDEDGVARVQQRPGRALELHGLAQVPVPVPGVQVERVQRPAVGAGVERDVRTEGGDILHRVEHLIADGIDLRRVGGVVDQDQAAAHPVPLTGGGEGGQRLGRSPDGRRAGAVDHRHGQVVRRTFQIGQDTVGRQGYGQQPAGSGDPGDGPAAQGHRAGGFVQGQGTADVSGGQLTLGVAHDGIGPDAVRAPYGGQRDHDREQQGLDDLHVVQARRPGGAAQHVGRGPVDVRGQRPSARLQFVPEDLGVLQQAQGHAGPLRSLAGEDEHDLGRVPRDAARRGGARLTRRERVERCAEPGTIAGDDHRPVVHLRARRGQRAAHVLGPQVRAAGQLPG